MLSEYLPEDSFPIGKVYSLQLRKLFIELPLFLAERGRDPDAYMDIEISF